MKYTCKINTSYWNESKSMYVHLEFDYHILKQTTDAIWQVSEILGPLDWKTQKTVCVHWDSCL